MLNWWVWWFYSLPREDGRPRNSNRVSSALPVMASPVIVWGLREDFAKKRMIICDLKDKMIQVEEADGDCVRPWHNVRISSRTLLFQSLKLQAAWMSSRTEGRASKWQEICQGIDQGLSNAGPCKQWILWLISTQLSTPTCTVYTV